MRSSSTSVLQTMKVLVIGGSGYMGKALVNQLLDANDTVLILNRGRTPDDFGVCARARARVRVCVFRSAFPSLPLASSCKTKKPLRRTGDRVTRLRADRSDRLQFRAALEQVGWASLSDLLTDSLTL